jgi:large subunit ribosomal protein L13
MTAPRQKKASQPKTFMLKQQESQPQWYTIDAAGKTLGRLSTEIARILRGKHKPTWTPHVDSGDGVIIINAEKVVVTGNKAAQKLYRHYTGFMSGLREIPYRTMLARKPDYIIEHAVKGMVPRTKLGRRQMKRLRVYAGDQHKMTAQTPVQVNI